MVQAFSTVPEIRIEPDPHRNIGGVFDEGSGDQKVPLVFFALLEAYITFD